MKPSDDFVKKWLNEWLLEMSPLNERESDALCEFFRRFIAAVTEEHCKAINCKAINRSSLGILFCVEAEQAIRNWTGESK